MEPCGPGAAALDLACDLLTVLSGCYLCGLPHAHDCVSPRDGGLATLSPGQTSPGPGQRPPAFAGPGPCSSSTLSVDVSTGSGAACPFRPHRGQLRRWCSLRVRGALPWSRPRHSVLVGTHLLPCGELLEGRCGGSMQGLLGHSGTLVRACHIQRKGQGESRGWGRVKRGESPAWCPLVTAPSPGWCRDTGRHSFLGGSASLSSEAALAEGEERVLG